MITNNEPQEDAAQNHQPEMANNDTNTPLEQRWNSERSDCESKRPGVCPGQHAPEHPLAPGERGNLSDQPNDPAAELIFSAHVIQKPNGEILVDYDRVSGASEQGLMIAEMLFRCIDSVFKALQREGEELTGEKLIHKPGFFEAHQHQEIVLPGVPNLENLIDGRFNNQ